MKTRMWKYAALFVSGGVLLQLGGCGGLLMNLFIQQIPVLVLGALNQALTANTPA